MSCVLSPISPIPPTAKELQSAVIPPMIPRRAPALPQLGDDPEGLLAPRHPLDVVESVPEGLGPVFPGRPRRVRRERHVLETEERVVDERRLLDHDVEACRGDLLREQSGPQRPPVPDPKSAGV